MNKKLLDFSKVPRQKLVCHLNIQVPEIIEIIGLFKGAKARQKPVCDLDIQDSNKKLLDSLKVPRQELVCNMDIQDSNKILLDTSKVPKQKLVYNLNIQDSEIEEIIGLFKGAKPRQKSVCLHWRAFCINAFTSPLTFTFTEMS